MQKVLLITGASSGMGKVAAQDLTIAPKTPATIPIKKVFSVKLST
ncbi:hypothetical protein NHP190033_02850 [Helicobacter suis]|nr:hypothetical protein NHP190033_02850 [Helicobacter suis]